MKHIQIIASKFNVPSIKVSEVIKLLESGATVPFIARYRKEMTGNLDEVSIINIRDHSLFLKGFDTRKESIIKSLFERNLLDTEVNKKIESCNTLSELEDFYLPYRPKKKTKASIAKAKGLEPLANIIFNKGEEHPDCIKFINISNGVLNEGDAITGAMHIISEWINENASYRSSLRQYFEKKAFLKSKVIKKNIDKALKFKDYFDFSESISRIPSHRILAILRGSKEGFLRVKTLPSEKESLIFLENLILKDKKKITKHILASINDSYKRLIYPSLENEMLKNLKERADHEAISVFTANLKALLLEAPLGQKQIIAIDPGFRTGCKLVVLNPQGKLLKNLTIFPFHSQKQIKQAEDIIIDLVQTFNIQGIAIGNGTGGRETESFLRKLALNVPIIQVNESGASIYSASQVARDEFPNHDITVRGSVSIGRRLQDPLAELVKINAKSIGVGQYQHDVNQSYLKTALDDTVLSCVNSVGVELNTASTELLSYVSGLSKQIAKNIVAYRDKNGPFSRLMDLKTVPRFGLKVFEQSAGFLRIFAGKNILDSTAVHPERYALVDKIAKDKNMTIKDLINNNTLKLQIDIKKYESFNIGLDTLQDILLELEKPGRDPRPTFELFSFSELVHSIQDLKEGMILPGIVTNITKFGAFVDIGVHQDGLVHISQIANKYIKDPQDVLTLKQIVKIKVLEIDQARKRISLSMKLGITEEVRS